MVDEGQEEREVFVDLFDALRSLRSCASRWDPEAFQTEIADADAALARARPILGYHDGTTSLSITSS